MVVELLCVGGCSPFVRVDRACGRDGALLLGISSSSSQLGSLAEEVARRAQSPLVGVGGEDFRLLMMDVGQGRETVCW